MANLHDVWVYPEDLQGSRYQEEIWSGAEYDGFSLPPSYFHNLDNKPQAQQDFLTNF